MPRPSAPLRPDITAVVVAIPQARCVVFHLVVAGAALAVAADRDPARRSALDDVVVAYFIAGSAGNRDADCRRDPLLDQVADPVSLNQRSVPRGLDANRREIGDPAGREKAIHHVVEYIA